MSRKSRWGQEDRKKVEREFDREIVVKAYLEELASIER